MKRFQHYPALLASLAIVMDIVFSVVVAPIIDDIKNEHKILKLETTERMERLEVEIQGARLSVYQNFETHQEHEQDMDKLLQRVVSLEKRIYELKH